MKIKYLFLMLSVATIAVGPAFAMDNDSNEGSVALVKPTQDRKDLKPFDLHSDHNLTNLHSRLEDLNAQTVKDEFGNEYDVYFAGDPKTVVSYLQTPVDMRMPNNPPEDEPLAGPAIALVLQPNYDPLSVDHIKTHGLLMNKNLFYKGSHYSPTELSFTYSGGTYPYVAFDGSILQVALKTQKIFFKKKEKPKA